MKMHHGSENLSDGIRVEVKPFYLPEHSHPGCNQFLFAYQVLLRNEDVRPVRVLGRSWKVIDADGQCMEISGPGVVGRMPVLMPGEEFEYISHCPLQTRWGTMEGSFRFERDSGEEITVPVNRFCLTGMRNAV